MTRNNFIYPAFAKQTAQAFRSNLLTLLKTCWTCKIFDNKRVPGNPFGELVALEPLGSGLQSPEEIGLQSSAYILQGDPLRLLSSSTICGMPSGEVHRRGGPTTRNPRGGSDARTGTERTFIEYAQAATLIVKKIPGHELMAEQMSNLTVVRTVLIFGAWGLALPRAAPAFVSDDAGGVGFAGIDAWTALDALRAAVASTSTAAYPIVRPPGAFTLTQPNHVSCSAHARELPTDASRVVCGHLHAEVESQIFITSSSNPLLAQSSPSHPTSHPTFFPPALTLQTSAPTTLASALGSSASPTARASNGPPMHREAGVPPASRRTNIHVGLLDTNLNEWRMVLWFFPREAAGAPGRNKMVSAQSKSPRETLQIPGQNNDDGTPPPN
ncbi:hypothetical protein DFH09DRAFT_1083852 [Mycena vulgaris]|nr:hypothetical protein DFH09DRAFT_1083852 [Mycena vulgaris]